MSVPLQDPAREYRALREELDEALRRVASSGRYVRGPEVEALERELAAYLGVGHVVTVASGTDALTLSLRALGVGSGDEVVLPAFSFFATAEAVLRAGAEPVFADIRPDTFNLDPGAAEAAVTGRTAALLPVHLFGQMADLEALAEVADSLGLALVEDAAQAMGAASVPERDGEGRGSVATGAVDRGIDATGGTGGGPHDADSRGGAWLRAGAVGDAGCFSFYPTKNLAALGDGGAVATDDSGTAARLRRLRDHGRDPDLRGRHGEVGWNSRLGELQAAALRIKLERLEEWNGRRRRHARAYDRALVDVDGIAAPPVRPARRHVYHQYTVRCGDRDGLAEHLSQRGIGHGVYYRVPLHRQPALAESGGGGGEGRAAGPLTDGEVVGARGEVAESPGAGKEEAPVEDRGAARLPESERAADQVLSLPVFPLLEDDERDRVIEALQDFGG